MKQLIKENLITHGGNRKGAGAKKKKECDKKEPTKVMRVPLSRVAAVLKIIKSNING